MSRASEIRDWLNGRGIWPEAPGLEDALQQFEQRIRAEERRDCFEQLAKMAAEEKAAVERERCRCAAIARKMGETEPGLSARHMGKAIAKAIEEGE